MVLIQVTKWIRTNQVMRKSGKKKRRLSEVVFQKVRVPDVRLYNGMKSARSKMLSDDIFLNFYRGVF